MNEDKPAWAKQMAESPFTRGPFTADLRDKVLQRAARTRGSRPGVMKLVGIPVLAAALGFGLLHYKDDMFPVRKASHGEAPGVTGARNSYHERGRLLFAVFPEPNARAGQTAGYMFHFEEPLDTFLGKTMTLQAVHLQSGAKQALSYEVITKPSPGYTGLERYTSRFALPLGGLWQVNVLLDEQPYGNVELYVLEPNWDITPEFRSGTYLMRGHERKIGFIDAGFITGQSQKYMWHFWGKEDLLNGPLEVKAVKQGSDRIIDVFASSPVSSANALAGEINGADRHAVTSMKLPEPGRWRLLPYVRGRLLDTIVVEVQ